MKEERRGRGLGWYRFALGLADIAAARLAAQAVGTRRRSGLFGMLGMKRRATLPGIFGMREMKTGLGILTRQRQAPWVWARVAGHAVDLFSLGSAFATDKRRRGRIGAALAAVAGLTALDIMFGRRMTKSH